MVQAPLCSAKKGQNLGLTFAPCCYTVDRSAPSKVARSPAGSLASSSGQIPDLPNIVIDMLLGSGSGVSSVPDSIALRGFIYKHFVIDCCSIVATCADSVPDSVALRSLRSSSNNTSSSTRCSVVPTPIHFRTALPFAASLHAHPSWSLSSVASERSSACMAHSRVQSPLHCYRPVVSPSICITLFFPCTRRRDRPLSAHRNSLPSTTCASYGEAH